MISQRLTAAVLMSAAMTLVGSGVVASKVIAGGMHPLLAVPLRFLISTPIFIGLIYLTRTAAPRLTVRQFLIVALQAAAGSAGYSILMIVALAMTTSASAGVIHGLLPVLAALVATLALGERLSARLWVAIAAATSGALLVNFSSSSGMGFDVRQLMGNLFVVTAVSGEVDHCIRNCSSRRSKTLECFRHRISLKGNDHVHLINSRWPQHGHPPQSCDHVGFHRKWAFPDQCRRSRAHGLSFRPDRHFQRWRAAPSECTRASRADHRQPHLRNLEPQHVILSCCGYTWSMAPPSVSLKPTRQFRSC
ncbi:MAG: EamA family transporter [Mesorhizobium sp.]|nr:MAG: EamA family transporter [Mesorhizobium sp.]TJW70701.1 MAG: DMT family transporter [Mesorhizobium sp.]